MSANVRINDVIAVMRVLSSLAAIAYVAGEMERMLQDYPGDKVFSTVYRRCNLLLGRDDENEWDWTLALPLDGDEDGDHLLPDV
jgi:hypothetical protein